MTDNDKIRYLHKCKDKEQAVVVIWSVTEQKPDKITLGDVVELLDSLQADKEALIAGQETMQKYIESLQTEIEDLNHGIDALGRVKEQLKETLSETEAKYQKEITRLDALLVCKNKVIRNLEKSFENAYDGAIKKFAKKLCEDRVSNDPVVIATKCLLKEMVGDAE